MSDKLYLKTPGRLSRIALAGICVQYSTVQTLQYTLLVYSTVLYIVQLLLYFYFYNAVKPSGSAPSEHRVAALKEAHALLSAFVGRLARDRQLVGVVALVSLLLLALMPLLFARVTTAGFAPDVSALGLGEAAAGSQGAGLGAGIGALTQVVSLIDSLGRSADAFHALQAGSPVPAGFNLKDLEVPLVAYRWNYAVRLYLVAAFLSLITALFAIVFVWALIVRYISQPIERRLVRGHLADIDLLLSLEKSSS